MTVAVGTLPVVGDVTVDPAFALPNEKLGFVTVNVNVPLTVTLPLTPPLPLHGDAEQTSATCAPGAEANATPPARTSPAAAAANLLRTRMMGHFFRFPCHFP